MVLVEPSSREEEVKYATKALTDKGYKMWVFKIPQKRKNVEDSSSYRAPARKFPISTPYLLGVSEQLQRVFRSHKHPNSAITEYTSTTGHKYTLADVNMLVKEDADIKMDFKEAIATHKKKPALNRDRGH